VANTPHSYRQKLLLPCRPPYQSACAYPKRFRAVHRATDRCGRKVGDAGANDPVFASRKKGGHLDAHSVHVMVKRTAKRARINEAVSPHWLRHAHGSHALDRGATLAQAQATLGHANVATTSGYLHARPNNSAGTISMRGFSGAAHTRARATGRTGTASRTATAIMSAAAATMCAGAS
jgi:Phage integrase family